MPRTRQVDFAVGELRQMTGKVYPHLEKAFEGMPPEAQEDLVRAMRDLRGEILDARRDGARQPWKR